MGSRVSAIVSAYYTHGRLVGRVENLMSQTLRPEIVVVCQEGSEEDRIIRDLEKSELVVVRTQDVPTVYRAWNLGIRASEGKYLTNANSDDRLMPEALERLAGALDKNPWAAVAYANVVEVCEYGGQAQKIYDWLEGGLEELVSQGCFLGPMPMWRRELHDRYGYFDEEMHSAGDYEFWLRIANKGERFVKVHDYVCGEYLRHDNNREHRGSLRSIWEQARARARWG